MSKKFFEIKTASPSNPSLWIDTGNELFGWFWLVWFVVFFFFCYLKSVKKYKVAKRKQILCLFVFKADCLFHIVSVVTDFSLWGERTKNSILLPWVQGELLWAIEQKCYEVNERLIELMITTAFLCSETSGFVLHRALYLYARWGTCHRTCKIRSSSLPGNCRPPSCGSWLWSENFCASFSLAVSWRWPYPSLQNNCMLLAFLGKSFSSPSPSYRGGPSLEWGLWKVLKAKGLFQRPGFSSGRKGRVKEVWCSRYFFLNHI